MRARSKEHKLQRSLDKLLSPLAELVNQQGE